MQTSTLRRPDAHPVTQAVTTVYQWGFRISLAILCIGILVAVARHEALVTELGKPAHVFGDAVHGHANGIIGVGILAMIMTPLVGALTMVVHFLRMRDRQFALFAGAIVLILIASIVFSLG